MTRVHLPVRTRVPWSRSTRVESVPTRERVKRERSLVTEDLLKGGRITSFSKRELIPDLHVFV